MPKMTRAQAKKRLNEARSKVKAVYMQPIGGNVSVTTGDMHAIDKIIEKCLKRLN